MNGTTSVGTDAGSGYAGRKAVLAGTAVVMSTVAAAAARHKLRNWGSTWDEQARQLPGDELVENATSVYTRAITIHAPPDEVWQWIVQIGQDRGGWYSYEGLENLFGLDIHNTDEVRDEWQRLSVGDEVRVAPAGSLGMKDGYAFRVAIVEPGRALVLRQEPPEHPWNATWAFLLAPDGWGGTRLLVRGRSVRPPGLAGYLVHLGGELLDPVTLIMTRRMLLGIRARAEFAHQRRLREQARITAPKAA
ncbi:MAG TPA: hypothetical protein VFR23_24050 [Jiangellaceae bacterium]|nr:hypothetical protein [Jiangellaceae bacterium]